MSAQMRMETIESEEREAVRVARSEATKTWNHGWFDVIEDRVGGKVHVLFGEPPTDADRFVLASKGFLPIGTGRALWTADLTSAQRFATLDVVQHLIRSRHDAP